MAHTVFDIVVDDEIEFLVGEAVMLCKGFVYFVDKLLTKMLGGFLLEPKFCLVVDAVMGSENGKGSLRSSCGKGCMPTSRQQQRSDPTDQRSIYWSICFQLRKLK